MIIGHGDIASVLPDRDDLTFFASGVSNSAEFRELEYKREIDLLMTVRPRSNHLVYFSSLCILYNPDTRYSKHKRTMENVVRTWFYPYTIMRLGNITWGANPRTLINHLRIRRAAGLPLDIQDTYRYLVDKDEFLHWIDLIPSWNCEMNVPGRRMLVADIVREFV